LKKVSVIARRRLRAGVTYVLAAALKAQPRLKTHRFNVVLPVPLAARVYEVMALTRAPTVADVLGAAIKLYVATVIAKQRGEVLVFRADTDQGKVERALDLEFLS
jgi:hypothetical protein